ncbi:uncharacterized protein LOC143892825 isoform X2 [Tasmannia lanceolata]|uniref:uncharacterized protein LOC143892825 isoform X2 n=1 Tax=Tasmannia lanceolata TaxID=3420 RepID=UPI004062ACEE
MGKSSKKSKTEVAAVPMEVSPAKSAKKGKRDAEDSIEKQASAKKLKIEVAEAVQKLNGKKKSKSSLKATPKKKQETSSSEDLSSEEEVKVAPKKSATKSAKPPVKESSSEESSSDEEPAVPKKLPTNVSKNGSVEALAKKAKPLTSSESDSDEEEEAGQKVTLPLKKLPVAAAKNGSAGVIKKKDSSDSSDSDSSSDEDNKIVAKVPAGLNKPVQQKIAPVSALKKKEESSESSESDSEDEVVAKVPAQSKKPAVTKIAAGASLKKMEESSETSESDSEDEEVAAKVAAGGKKPVLLKTVPGPASKKKEESSDSSESDSEEEDNVAKAATPLASKSAPVSVKKEEESSEGSESDSSEDDDNDVEMKDASVARSNNKKTTTKSKELQAPVTPSAKTTGSKSLFVGNLSFNVERADVEEFFKDAGEVVDVRFASNEEGRFKGFGHVEFATPEEAQKALELNGQELLGRTVKLDLAHERGSYTPHSGKDNNSFQKGGRGGQGQTIFVRGFDKSLEEGQIRSNLEEHFGSCGEISRVSIPKDYDTGAPKGMAYLDFKDSDSFSKALELNGDELGGYSLTVEEARPRDGDSGRGGRSGGRGGGRDSGGRFGGRRGGGRFGSGGGGRFGGGGGRSGGGRGRGGFNKPNMAAAGTGRKTTFDD